MFSHVHVWTLELFGVEILQHREFLVRRHFATRIFSTWNIHGWNFLALYKNWRFLKSRLVSILFDNTHVFWLSFEKVSKFQGFSLAICKIYYSHYLKVLMWRWEGKTTTLKFCNKVVELFFRFSHQYDFEFYSGILIMPNILEPSFKQCFLTENLENFSNKIPISNCS